jgi:hypothetical protein
MTQSTVFGAVPIGGGQQVLDDLNLSDQALATEHEGAEAPSDPFPFQRWRDHAEKFLYRRNGTNSGWEIIENYGATADPTTGDDSADGYIRSSLWVNVTDDRIFWCTNPAAGAATWVEAGSGGAGATSVFGRTGAVAAADGDYTADQIDDGGGKVIMTEDERDTLAAISFPTKVIPLAGTNSDSDNANIRAAIAAIQASGQAGEIRMSGDFKIGHASDKTGIDPDDCPDLKLTGRGYCRWYKGVVATTTGLTGGTDPGDDTAYPLLARSTDDGPGKRLVIRDIIFEGDLATTQKWLGPTSRLISLARYDRIELIDVEGRWASETGFHLSYCNEVRAHRINLDRIAARGLDGSNCADVAVTDSDFAWTIDDCCSVRLAESAATDLGQQRTFRFSANRIYNCGGVKVLGGKSVIIIGNSFRVPSNYAVFIGAEATEGLRVSEDIMVVANNITDIVKAAVSGAAIQYDCGIFISQFTYSPHNVIVRGNNLAQRTSGTDGLTWAQIKPRGIAGENRQWRRDGTTGDVMFYDTTMTGEVFVGSCSAIRVEAPNALDRITLDIDENRLDGFSEDDYVRSQPAAWDGQPELWAVPASPGEVSLGEPARFTGLDLRGFTQMRLVLNVGGQPGVTDSMLYYRYSVDGGSTWYDTDAAIQLDGSTNQGFWGSWQPIPPLMRQSIDITVALFGKDGDGSTVVELVDWFVLDVRGLDVTSAARLLPKQVTPAEIADPSETELRSFSPKDIADIVAAVLAS